MTQLYWNCFSEPASLPERVDCLCVINQDTQPQHIVSSIGTASAAIIISTHAPFPEEIDEIASKLPKASLTWRTMSSLLDDNLMETCDDLAIAACSDPPTSSEFMLESRRFRNFEACKALAKSSRWERCIVDDGLGIVPDAWPDAARFPKKKGENSSLLARLRHRIASLGDLCRFELVEHNGETYVFVGPTRRLKLREGTKVRTERIGLLSALARGAGSGFEQRILSGALKAVSEKVGKPLTVCTTVHAYLPWFLDSSPQIRVFVDGLHTPNYPVSYGASYRGATIVAREDCDRQWFEKCGCRVIDAPAFIEPEPPAQLPADSRPIRTIGLMLNHAGDWTALIDRSDTDFTILEFVKAARQSGLEFRIRLHPTMATEEHEGMRSMHRVREWIEHLNIPNLSLSSGSLDEDIEWSDCVVSEYSNVLVDCLKQGKACIALNPTNRRSFLAYLEPDLPTVSDAEGILLAISDLTSE